MTWHTRTTVRPWLATTVSKGCLAFTRCRRTAIRFCENCFRGCATRTCRRRDDTGRCTKVSVEICTAKRAAAKGTFTAARPMRQPGSASRTRPPGWSRYRWSLWRWVFGRLGRLDQAELLQHRDAIVETDLLDDQPVDHLEHRRTGEPHRLAAAGRQRTDRHVIECLTGVRSATDP